MYCVILESREKIKSDNFGENEITQIRSERGNVKKKLQSILVGEEFSMNNQTFF